MNIAENIFNIIQIFQILKKCILRNDSLSLPTVISLFFQIAIKTVIYQSLIIIKEHFNCILLKNRTHHDVAWHFTENMANCFKPLSKRFPSLLTRQISKVPKTPISSPVQSLLNYCYFTDVLNRKMNIELKLLFLLEFLCWANCWS